MLMSSADSDLVGMVRGEAHRVTGRGKDCAPLLDLVEDASVVLIGEHSTVPVSSTDNEPKSRRD